jgi:hypothetical protein
VEHGDSRKQFIIPVGAEVRFQIDLGTAISRNAKLLVNKPKKLASGELEYTITQPLKNRVASEEEEGSERAAYIGSDLDQDYLEMVEPHRASSVYLLEFRVHFKESGSFFVQVAYDDELDSSLTKYTAAQYINVEPEMRLAGRAVRCKELSLLTVMSRCLGKLTRWS